MAAGPVSRCKRKECWRSCQDRSIGPLLAWGRFVQLAPVFNLPDVECGAMKPLAAFGHISLALAGLLTGLAFGQAKSKLVPQTRFPISKYMRNVGLTYWEHVEELNYPCIEDDQCADHWELSLSQMEDRITIALDEPGTPTGDVLFLKLLKNARLAKHMQVITGHLSVLEHGDAAAAQTALDWIQVDATCSVLAHESAVSGIYNKANDCESSLNALVKASSAPIETPSDSPWHAIKSKAECEAKGYKWVNTETSSQSAGCWKK